ncbi:MAG: DNA polymerase IV [Eggerthellaceae bacterium]|nr:DNA polymerase IV [Eggerthellaceae bacterium]
MKDETFIEALEAVPWEGPAILLVDLDAFFASVEQLDHPAWRGKPVIVGGSSKKRGVVSTCSYEARSYGVRSAMPSVTADRLCPDAIWTVGHFDRYREMSNAVMSILGDETPHVQQVSIDEAFLDVTPTRFNREHPVSIARRIQDRVEQLGVSCSIGVGTSKAVAKLASDMDKPKGLTVVMPGSELSFMSLQPVRALSGIGPSAAAKLHDYGIDTLGELAAADDELIEKLLGKNGAVMLERARGIEMSKVMADDDIKSVSNEISFADDLTDRQDIEAAIAIMASKVCRRLRRKDLKGSTLALKVRHADLSFQSVQRPLDKPSDDEFMMISLLHTMLDDVWSEGMPLRLVGVAVTGFDRAEETQLSLFDIDTARTTRDERHRSLSSASDDIKDRFGESALRFGRELRLKNINTGSSSKNPADYK